MAKWTAEQRQAAREAYANRMIKLTKVEDFNGEEEIEPDDYSNRFKMFYEDKIVSMTNAVKILPPNMIKDGRHLKENIQAICGFKVTDEMMDDVYSNFQHEAY